MPIGSPPPTATGCSVDVHCHVFNANDVPVRSFVEHVYLERNGADILDGLLTFICWMMTTEAPTAQDELNELGGSGPATARSRPSREQRKAAAVRRGILKMLDGDPTYDHRPSVRSLRPASRNYQNREWILQYFQPSSQTRLLRGLSFSARPTEIERARLRLQRDSLVATWIEFAVNYTQSRGELMDQLAGLAPAQSSDVMLYTPALLDIGHWVGQPGTSDVGMQIRIMSLISARPGKAYAVHAFVPFDPWRAIGDRELLKTVRTSIETQGCIGVKLYPPMGFKPFQNDSSTFPPYLYPAYTNGAQLVDEQMRELLDYCLSEDVPILAHCSYSQFVTEAGGRCADPANWRAYLDASPGHRSLRLNLGHFGGPWNLTRDNWTQTVIAMLGQYPNLYSDISDAAFVLDEEPENKAIVEWLRNALDPSQPNSANARSRLMYGSDWSLLARERNHETYFNRMRTYFCDQMNFTAAERQGYLGKNALNFLGLVKAADGTSPKSRKRLEMFRQNQRLSNAWLDAVDALEA